MFVKIRLLLMVGVVIVFSILIVGFVIVQMGCFVDLQNEGYSKMQMQVVVGEVL